MKWLADRNELFRLFDALGRDALSAAALRRLQRFLTSSADVRRLWFIYCDIERGLVRWAATQQAFAAAACANGGGASPAAAALSSSMSIAAIGRKIARRQTFSRKAKGGAGGSMGKG